MCNVGGDVFDDFVDFQVEVQLSCYLHVTAELENQQVPKFPTSTLNHITTTTNEQRRTMRATYRSPGEAGVQGAPAVFLFVMLTPYHEPQVQGPEREGGQFNTMRRRGCPPLAVLLSTRRRRRQEAVPLLAVSPSNTTTTRMFLLST
jgi:hypothetical protein